MHRVHSAQRVRSLGAQTGPVTGSRRDPAVCPFAFMLLYVHGGEMAIRDGGRVGRGRQSEGSTEETARK